jgi:hypothetical protein
MTPQTDLADLDRAALDLLAELARTGGARTRQYSPQRPTERQKLFLDCQHREAFYGGAAGGGKSSALLMAALRHVDVPNYSAILFRRTYADLSKPGALMDRAHEWLQGSGAVWNEQRKQWRFPSGAVLAFGYLENEKDKFRYQGAEFQFVGFDEASQFPESAYLYLFSRLRRLKSAQNVPIRMRAASNPGGVGAHWVKARFIPDGFNPTLARESKVFEKEGRAFVPAQLRDNPHLDREEYELSLQNLDDVTRAQLLEGDWDVFERGNVYPMWSDGVNGRHVITWSQFEGVFGARGIPSHWRGAVGQDWGFNPDPCATVWNFVAAENSALPGAVFCPRLLTCTGHTADEVAEKIATLEGQQRSQIEYRVLSHEASSEQRVYQKLGLNFLKVKPDANGGISQMRHALRVVEPDLPHPFKPWLSGRPNYFVVVPDDQLTNPDGDRGLALLREEFAVYRYIDTSPTEQRGSPKVAPYDFFNHCMDAQRFVAARWFARAEPLTESEKEELALPAGWRRENAPPLGTWRREGWEMAREAYRGVQKGIAKENGSDGFVQGDDWQPGEGLIGTEW